MDIMPDGTFAGEFNDSDMGVSGEGYDSTMYYSKFSGTCKNPQKIDAYTYSFELDEILYDNTPDTEEIITQDSWRNRVVYTDAYGLVQGLIDAYSASAPINTLPDGLMSWINLFLDDDARSSGILPVNSLFVVEPEYGWIEYEPEPES